MISDDPLWYKDAIIYEVPVRAYHDASGSGGGDFRGLTQKLDYLEDLGINAIWVLPFYPSPLRDDGYDIADYTSVNPIYGSLDDFKEFLAEAHRRGIRVITELVINHTSDQHPWFQRARRSPPGSNERNFYVWSDTPEKYANVPLMFPDFENSNWTWDSVAKQYYWHRFYSHQPDLNFDNPAVWEALFPVVDFWMELGVDGMRLDAVPYLFEREGTACEHLPETHAFLKALRAHVDAKYPNRMFLAEANAWPEDAVSYFGNGDECQMAFHFPLMPRLFMALQQEDRFPILDIFAQTPAIPETSQWCLFLRNHDELTLAMVTDEERDYMFRAYARDQQARIFLGIRHRLAPLMRNDRRRIELMNALLLSLPGTPVIYYGDEIGMGDNIYLGDRNGVRTPMQWSADRNAGFSRANPQKLFLPVILDPEYHFEAVNVETQQNNPSSLLWWMKRALALRKQRKAFGRGSIEFLRPDNPKVLAYIRRYESEIILVVANLSRFVQHVEIDLHEYAGHVPEELHSHGRFPAISEVPFPLTLGPHGCYWFALEAAATVTAAEPERTLPNIAVNERWSELIDGVGRDELEAVLPQILKTIRPYRGSSVLSARIVRTIRLKIEDAEDVYLVGIRIETPESLPDVIALPLTFAAEDAKAPALARITGRQPGWLCDAATMATYLATIIRHIASRQQQKSGDCTVAGVPATEAKIDTDIGETAPTIHWDDAGNLTASFGSKLLVEQFRTLYEGIHPDVEMARFLGDHGYAGIVPVLGSLELRRPAAPPVTLAILRPVLPNHGTAWEAVQHLLSQFFERSTAASHESANAPVMEDYFAEGLVLAERLAKQLAGLHRALAADRINPAFAPEPFSRTYQRSVYQSIRTRLAQLVRQLKRDRNGIPGNVSASLDQFLERVHAIDDRLRNVIKLDPDGFRIRCHGDYHLGRLIFTGDQFILADFEGEADRSISDRRIKRSPLRDLATLLRSLDYVVAASVYGLDNPLGRVPGVIREEDKPRLLAWSRQWLERCAHAVVETYVEEMAAMHLLPTRTDALAALLNVFQLERTFVELESDLQHRPLWSFVPLDAALRLADGNSI